MIDTLRSLIQQGTEKRLELLELERQIDAKQQELAKLNRQLEERRTHAKGFAGAMSDLFSAYEKTKKKGKGV